MSNSGIEYVDPEEAESWKKMTPNDFIRKSLSRMQFDMKLHRTCSRCKHCYDQDPYEMDGLCKLKCSGQDNPNYTYLDAPACWNFKDKTLVGLDKTSKKK